MKLLQQGILISTSRIVNYVLGFLFTFLVARLYGAEILGNYVFLYSLVSLLSPIVASGAKQGVMFYLPRWKGNPEYRQRISTLCKSSLIIIFFLGILIWTGYALLSSYIINFFNSNPNNILTLRWFSSIIIFEALTVVMTGILRGLGEIRYFSIGIYITYGLRIIILLIFFLVYKCADVIILTYYVAAILTTFFYVKSVAKLNAFSGGRWTDFRYYAVMLRKFFPVVFTGLILVLQNKLAPILIEFFLESQDVGIFSVSLNIASLSSFFLVSLNMLISPVVSNLYARNKTKEIEDIYSRSTRMVGLASFLFVSLMVCFGPTILSYFGNEFKEGYLILLIICCGQMINSITGSSAQIITMVGKPRILTFFSITALIVNLTLSIVLIPAFHLYGAAIGTAVSICTYNLLSARFVLKNIGLQAFDIKAIAYYIVQIAILAVCFFLMYIRNFPDSFSGQAMILILLSGALSFVHLGLFWKQDRKSLAKTLKV